MRDVVFVDGSTRIDNVLKCFQVGEMRLPWRLEWMNLQYNICLILVMILKNVRDQMEDNLVAFQEPRGGPTQK